MPRIHSKWENKSCIQPVLYKQIQCLILGRHVSNFRAGIIVHVTMLCILIVARAWGLYILQGNLALNILVYSGIMLFLLVHKRCINLITLFYFEFLTHVRLYSIVANLQRNIL